MQDEEEQIQSSKIRREMKVYETLARTAHADFFPPKDRLAEYQRKEIINTGIDLNRGRVSSVASVKRKMVDSRRQSLVATRSTFQNTASSFKPMWKVDKEAVSTTPTPFRIAEHNDELQAEMNEIADALRSRKANQ